MNSKKTVLVVISIVVICIITVLLEIILGLNVKKYDTENIQARVVDWYDNMREMDFIDSTDLFGYDITEEDGAFLTTYDTEITTNTIVIVVINSKDTDLYYDLFKGFYNRWSSLYPRADFNR